MTAHVSSIAVSWLQSVSSAGGYTLPPDMQSFPLPPTLTPSLVFACRSRYLAAFHILSLSPRNSSQCCFLCRRIVR
ncbi:hypothetical protein K469DRAFT_82797 [Zopfia rhizophila CBS 207.26]|uniref:Uncharacterized protein n=1 Tax=Zopfia rhizophila CBS 207.26 TaxID=1314779 RepID=A0A6A6EDB2_9PEZI|nr:hypothetical protein K469DRAFT_82797 [Zopfia rhizophila CBS 207.26]